MPNMIVPCAGLVFRLVRQNHVLSNWFYFGYRLHVISITGGSLFIHIIIFMFFTPQINTKFVVCTKLFPISRCLDLIMAEEYLIASKQSQLLIVFMLIGCSDRQIERRYSEVNFQELPVCITLISQTATYTLNLINS